jgi:type II secretory pathway pseudopilin PulG
MAHRTGLTVIELLILIAILGILIALLLPGILAARETAIRLRSQDNQRQIILAAHNFASAHSGRMPSIDGNANSANPDLSFFGALYENLGSTESLFVSPADPSVDPADPRGACSYAANGQLFYGDPDLARSIPDGTAYTIALAEHYSTGCQDDTFMWVLPTATRPNRRSTFADREAGDIFPVTIGWPPMTAPDIPGLTFQVAPSPFGTGCFPLVAQTPHRAGMLAAMLDGSCRMIAPNVASSVYWAAVTPAGGENLVDW